MTHIIAHQFIDGFKSNPHFPAEKRELFEIPGTVEAVPLRFGFDQIPFEMSLRYIVQRSCVLVVNGAELRTRGRLGGNSSGEPSQPHAGIRQTRVLNGRCL